MMEPERPSSARRSRAPTPVPDGIVPLPPRRIPALRKALLARYDAHPRDMPWRGDRDPYRIWVSEVMLQQTRVDTIRVRFPPFIARFPTVDALAGASDDEVMKAWEGLGYYTRARNLLSAARIVRDTHGGVVPADLEGLRSLPGCGPYTAAAVASLAFGLPAAVVDGNVERVLVRLTNDSGDLGRAATKARIRETADRLIDPRRPGDWNAALMDLGSVVCTPRAPRCPQCPWGRVCAARAAGTAADLPVKPARRPRPHHDIAAGLIWKGASILIGRRPARGLLGGLYELPGGKRQGTESLEAACTREIREETGLAVDVVAPFTSVRHAYSHFEITLHVFHCRIRSGRVRARGTENLQFVPWDGLDAFAFPRANGRVLEELRRVGPPAFAQTTGRKRSTPRGPGTLRRMANTYSYPIPAGLDAAALLAKAKEAGRSKGIVFSGDTTAGRFQGPADGTYTVADGAITIAVEKKPAFVPWKMIENALKDLFGPR